MDSKQIADEYGSALLHLTTETLKATVVAVEAPERNAVYGDVLAALLANAADLAHATGMAARDFHAGAERAFATVAKVRAPLKAHVPKRPALAATLQERLAGRTDPVLSPFRVRSNRSKAKR